MVVWRESMSDKSAEANGSILLRWLELALPSDWLLQVCCLRGSYYVKVVKYGL